MTDLMVKTAKLGGLNAEGGDQTMRMATAIGTATVAIGLFEAALKGDAIINNPTGTPGSRAVNTLGRRAIRRSGSPARNGCAEMLPENVAELDNDYPPVRCRRRGSLDVLSHSSTCLRAESIRE